MHRNVIPLKTETDQNRRSNRFRHMQIPSMVLMFIVSVVPIVQADPYEVLVVDIAGANDVERIEEFEKDAEKFNSLHRQGHSAAKPYFNLLYMANGQVYFVFGFRGEVQGIHRRNYPGTVENLRRLKHKGVQKYPHMHWLPVEEIRRLLTVLGLKFITVSRCSFHYIDNAMLNDNFELVNWGLKSIDHHIIILTFLC